MNIINVEERAFEMLLNKVQYLTDKINKLAHIKGDKGFQEWLDAQEVCQILNISKRTLQTYRVNGMLRYSFIERKIFYKLEDVNQLLIENKKTNKIL